MSTETKNKKKFFEKVPHTYFIIVLVVLFVWALTWIIPSGSFDYETTVINGVERDVPIADSYHIIEKNSDNRVSSREVHI